MARSVLMKIDKDIIVEINRGILGYAASEYSSCYIILLSGAAVKLSVFDVNIAPKFDCFSLALEMSLPPKGSFTAFRTSIGDTAVSVLIREEYIEPFTGDPSSLVGGLPANVQSAAKPGHVPTSALARCLVAYGLLIEGRADKLIAIADWAPFNIEVTTERARIEAILAESEVMPAAQCLKLHGCCRAAD